MEALIQHLSQITPVEWGQMAVMWLIGGILIFLAIKKDMEPALLLPLGFGAILVNLPFSGAVDQAGAEWPLDTLFRAGIDNELFPLLLFIGIGAMIDFGPLLSNPKLFLFGAAAQFGIFFTFSLACLIACLLYTSFFHSRRKISTRLPELFFRQIRIPEDIYQYLYRLLIYLLYFYTYL